MIFTPHGPEVGNLQRSKEQSDNCFHELHPSSTNLTGSYASNKSVLHKNGLWKSLWETGCVGEGNMAWQLCLSSLKGSRHRYRPLSRPFVKSGAPLYRELHQCCPEGSWVSAGKERRRYSKVNGLGSPNRFDLPILFWDVSKSLCS